MYLKRNNQFLIKNNKYSKQTCQRRYSKTFAWLFLHSKTHLQLLILLFA